MERISDSYVKSEYLSVISDIAPIKGLEDSFLKGNPEQVLSNIKSGVINSETAFTVGEDLLTNGKTAEFGDRKILSTTEAASVLGVLVASSSTVLDESSTAYALSQIDRMSPTLPETEKRESELWLQEQRMLELKSRVIHLLSKGNILLFPYLGEEFSDVKKRTGLGFVEALVKIEEFNQDFENWGKRILEIPTTDSASLPHVFEFILNSLGMSNGDGKNFDGGEQVYLELKKIYESSSSGRSLVRKAFDLSLTNYGTGDRQSEFDKNVFPLVYDNIGKNPGWLELTVSKGVMMMGTVSRMKTLGMSPVWGAVDLYEPTDEAWIGTKRYYSVCDDVDPWKILNLADTDPTDVHKRVKDFFNSKNGYVGFLRQNFELPDFKRNVLKFWKEKTGQDYPDVIRMTGTIAATNQSMWNLINTVNPNGGLLVFGGDNNMHTNDRTVWKVNANEAGVRISNLYKVTT